MEIPEDEQDAVSITTSIAIESPNPNEPSRTTVLTMTYTRPRRKPVPPPKTTANQSNWAAPPQRPPRRRPVSSAVLQYTITITGNSQNPDPPPSPASAGSAGLNPPVMQRTPPTRASTISLSPLPETREVRSFERTPAELAITKDNMVKRRARSLPPVGPGPTEMYCLPILATPAYVPMISRNISMVRRQYISSVPVPVPQNMSFLQRLQSMADASIRPPQNANGPDIERTVANIKRIATRPFTKKSSVSVRGNIIDPLSGATYPIAKTKVRRKPVMSMKITTFDMGQWIDSHFDMLQVSSSSQRSFTLTLPRRQTFQFPRNVTFPNLSIPRSLTVGNLQTRFKLRRKPVNERTPPPLEQQIEQPTDVEGGTAKTQWNLAPRIPKFKSFRRFLPTIRIQRKPVPVESPPPESVAERSRVETVETVRRVMTEITYHRLSIEPDGDADSAVSVGSRMDEGEGDEIVEAEAVVTHVSKERLDI